MVKLKAEQFKKYVEIFQSDESWEAIEQIVFILADEFGWDLHQVTTREVAAVTTQVSQGKEYVEFDWIE